MNGLTLSLTRRSTGNTVEIYRHGRRITIHPVGPNGTLAPRFARGTGITAEEVQWILRRAIELATEEGEPEKSAWPVAMTKTTRFVLYLSLIAFGAFLAWGVHVVVTEPRDPPMGAP